MKTTKENRKGVKDCEAESDSTVSTATIESTAVNVSDEVMMSRLAVIREEMTYLCCDVLKGSYRVSGYLVHGIRISNDDGLITQSVLSKAMKLGKRHHAIVYIKDGKLTILVESVVIKGEEV